MRRVPLSAPAAILACILLTPIATAGKEPPVHPGPDNAFGTVWVEPYPTYEGQPVSVDATFAMKNWSRVSEVAHVMIAFNVHNPTLKVEFTSITGPGGQAIPLQQDRRDESEVQPKVFVATSDLPQHGTPVHLTARVAATNDGGYHLGVFALAFDEDWNPMLMDDGYQAQVYWFTTVGSFDQDRGPLDPPFEGRGNTIPGLGLLGLVGTTAIAVAWRRRVMD